MSFPMLTSPIRMLKFVSLRYMNVDFSLRKEYVDSYKNCFSRILFVHYLQLKSARVADSWT